MRKKWQHDPNKKTCPSKEREERKDFRVVEACNLKQENVKHGLAWLECIKICENTADA